MFAFALHINSTNSALTLSFPLFYSGSIYIVSHFTLFQFWIFCRYSVALALLPFPRYSLSSLFLIEDNASSKCGGVNLWCDVLLLLLQEYLDDVISYISEVLFSWALQHNFSFSEFMFAFYCFSFYLSFNIYINQIKKIFKRISSVEISHT